MQECVAAVGERRCLHSLSVAVAFTCCYCYFLNTMIAISFLLSFAAVAVKAVVATVAFSLFLLLLCCCCSDVLVLVVLSYCLFATTVHTLHLFSHHHVCWFLFMLLVA